MKPFDDTLPEEQESKYRELIDLVQHARRPSVSSISTEQDQAVARVQQRLIALEYATTQSENGALQLEDIDIQTEENEQEQARTSKTLLVGSPNTPEIIPRRKHRNVQILNTLVAVFVVGLLIGTSLLLFRQSSQSTTMTGPAIGPVGTPVSVHTTSDGLEMSMSITPGPYFLSELLAVDISITNHTHITYQLTGDPSQASSCSMVFLATLTGGRNPYFSLFKKMITYDVGCLSIASQLPLKPGQTISTRQYVPLTNSGQNTLTAQLFSPIGTYPNTFDPFKGHLLSTRLNVMPLVPTDRSILSIQQHGSEVQVTASSSVPRQLADYSLVVCWDSQGKQQEAGDFSWMLLTTHILKEPDCPGNNVQWIYGVGAAGYAIAGGDFSA